YEPGELPGCSTPRRGAIVAPRLQFFRGLGCLLGAHRRRSRDARSSRIRRRPLAPGLARLQALPPPPRAGARRPRRGRRAHGGGGRAGDRLGRAHRLARAPAAHAHALRRPAGGARRGNRLGHARHGGLSAQMRVAALDLGTNTTRLLVADVDDDALTEVHRETRITRLGEGVDARRRLLPVPIARVRNVLSDYRRIVEELGAERTLLVATSAVRDAENGEAFLGEIEWSYGFATRLVSGDEEAQLTRRGVQPPAGALVVDVGGGSTELVVDDAHLSLDIGSVRFTERFVHTDPPDSAELAECARAARDVLEQRAHMTANGAIGVAGTVTTLAALDLQLDRYDRERVHGHRLTRDGASRQLDRLAALPLAERREVPALDPDRAPVIVAGAVILVAILDRFGIAAIEVSERDILDGIAFAAAELPAPEEGAAPPGAYTCC